MVDNASGTLKGIIDASSHTEGKFRLSRQSGNITGYYFDSMSSDWVIVFSGFSGETDVKVSLQVWSHDSLFSDQDVGIVFDDFIVDEGQVIVSEIFVPLIVRK